MTAAGLCLCENIVKSLIMMVIENVFTYVHSYILAKCFYLHVFVKESLLVVVRYILQDYDDAN